MRQWLQITRFSGLATVFANLTAAVTVAVYSEGLNWRMLAHPVHRHLDQALWVLVASFGLYCSGMLWNDIADWKRDETLAPNRPLPSGRIDPSAVWAVGLFLPVCSLLAAAQVGWRGLFSGGMVLGWALLYNLWAKHVPVVGSLCMGAVRASYALFALLLLGADYFDRMVLSGLALVGYAPASALGTLPPVYPLMLFSYIAGLTFISELESRQGTRLELLLGGLLVGGTILFALARGVFDAHWILSLLEEHRLTMAAGGVLLVVAVALLLLLRIAPAWWHAVRSGQRSAVPAVVRAGLGGMILMDALVVMAHHPAVGVLLVLFFPVFLVAGRAIRMD